MQPNRGFGGSEAPKPRILRWFGAYFLDWKPQSHVFLRGFKAFWARKSLSGGLRAAALEAPEAARRLPIGAKADF